MVQALVKYNPDLDFVTLNGDLIAHGLALTPGMQDGNFTLMKQTHVEVQQLFSTYLASTPVFMVFGNNDCHYHDSAPFQSEKEEYYSFIYKLWFQTHPANKRFDTDQVKSTFMQGGYYRINWSENLAILAYNSLENNVDQYQKEIGPEKESQFQWLENVLSEESKQKCLILTHIYSGARLSHNKKNDANDLWNAADSKRYFNLAAKYKSKIILEIGAHDHWEDLRVYQNKDEPYRNLLVSTGISPNQSNMPGFSTFEISNEGNASNLVLTTLDLIKTYGLSKIPVLDELTFNQLNFSKYGFSDLSPSGLVASYDSLQSGQPETIDNFLSDKEGYDHTQRLDQGIDLVSSWGLLTSDHSSKPFFCQATRSKNAKKLLGCINSTKSNARNFFTTISELILLIYFSW
jgi:predicted phosphodiesterase